MYDGDILSCSAPMCLAAAKKVTTVTPVVQVSIDVISKTASFSKSYMTSFPRKRTSLSGIALVLWSRASPPAASVSGIALVLWSRASPPAASVSGIALVLWSRASPPAASAPRVALFPSQGRPVQSTGSSIAEGSAVFKTAL
jgi:hypothetical protein